MSLARGGLSENVESKLVEFAFAEKKILIAGVFVHVAVAAFAFDRTRQGWFIGWAVAALLLLVLRLWLIDRFEQRHIRSGRYLGWKTCLIVGSCLNGLLTGIGGSITILACDPFTDMLVITMISGFVMGAAARTAVVPASAISCVVGAELPLIVACFASSNRYFMLYTVLIAVSMAIAISFVRKLYTQTAEFLAASEDKALLNDELARANALLERMASTDALTGVANRRRFDDVLHRETGRLGRDAGQLSLLMLDVDFFKAYNDRYGHGAGDAALCRVATEAAACLRRPADVFARYGGEEFVAVLPETDAAGALEVAEMIRARIESLKLENADASPPFLTVSVGVATVPHTAHGVTDNDLVNRADAALYAAKSAGRNRVHIDGADQSPQRYDASLGATV